LDALREALNKIFVVTGGELVRDRVHDAEHVLGAMVDFAREKVRLFLVFLAFGNIRNGADDARGSSPTPSALKTSKPMSLNPADPSAFPLNPVHDR
jgi:hypothetical protein